VGALNLPLHANFKAAKLICISISLKISLVKCYKCSGDVSFFAKKAANLRSTNHYYIVLYSIL
jgi:hypothetical protein